MKIGIYGGTFNPPHLGHAAAARFAMEALELDRLLFIPAALPPHKALPPSSPTPDGGLYSGTGAGGPELYGRYPALPPGPVPGRGALAADGD